MTDEHDDDNGAPPAPKATVTRVTDYVVPLFRQAFEEHGQGERIAFELTVEALPGPAPSDAPINPQTGQQDPSWESMLILYVEIPAAIPEHAIIRSWSLMPHAWTQQKADQVVSQLVMPQMLEGRSRHLEQVHREAREAMAGGGNGNGGPPSGLIMPGSR